MRARVLIVGASVLAGLLGPVAFLALTLDPLASAGGFGVATSDAPNLGEWPARPVIVDYDPRRRIYLTVRLLNDGPVPVIVAGVDPEPPAPSGYLPRWLAFAPPDGMPRGGAAAEPFTLEPKGTRTVVIVYEPTTDCERLPIAAPEAGATGTVFVGAELRFRLGFVPRTQFVRVGRSFFVPQPSRSDCLARVLG